MVSLHVLQSPGKTTLRHRIIVYLRACTLSWDLWLCSGCAKIFFFFGQWVYPTVTSCLAPLSPLQSLECPAGTELRGKQLSHCIHLLSYWFTDCTKGQTKQRNSRMGSESGIRLITSLYFRDQMFYIKFLKTGALVHQFYADKY